MIEKAKLDKWLLINNIFIDEYLYLLYFLAQNLARNKKSRCLNHKTYVLFHLLECRLVAYEKWSFLCDMCYNIYGFRVIFILILICGSSAYAGLFSIFSKKVLYIYIRVCYNIDVKRKRDKKT